MLTAEQQAVLGKLAHFTTFLALDDYIVLRKSDKAPGSKIHHPHGNKPNLKTDVRGQCWVCIAQNLSGSDWTKFLQLFLSCTGCPLKFWQYQQALDRKRSTAVHLNRNPEGLDGRGSMESS